MLSYIRTFRRIPKPILFFLIPVGLFWGCRQKPHWEADVTATSKPNISISRYEEVLFNLNPFTLREDIDPYIGEFYFFLGEAIDTAEGQEQLFDYITDPFLISIYQDLQEIWSTVDPLETSLSEALRYYQYHFPNHPLPRLYTYISGLDYHLPIKYAEGHMAIGIDMYLGADYPKYAQAGIPQYMRERFTPGHTALDAMRMLAESHLQEKASRPETLLDFMIYEGKVLYFLDCMFPRKSDTLKMPYTTSQLHWMRNNAGPVWAYFIENDMVYSTDRQMINKFVGDAPFTAAFSENSAPRTAAWLGWQMVREYMRRHPEISLQKLLQETDSRKILAASRYRPR